MIYNKVYNKFQERKISKKSFFSYAKNLFEVDNDELVLEILKAAGFWFIANKDFLELGTTYKNYKNTTFCFVDIETTGSKPMQSQVIEIGAIKYCNGSIVDKFQTLVFADLIPQNIVELTNIHIEMLKDAPSEKNALNAFRKFLGDSVFIAHNVNFDYSFISQRMSIYGEIGLLNPRICTVELSRKSILSLKHSLAYLNKFLGINIQNSHRAYEDAFACLRVFEIAMLSLPKGIESVQDLIEFSRGKRI